MREEKISVHLIATDEEIIEVMCRLDDLIIDFDFQPCLGGAKFVLFLTPAEEEILQRDPLLGPLFYGKDR